MDRRRRSRLAQRHRRHLFHQRPQYFKPLCPLPPPTPPPAGPTAVPTPFDLPQGWLAYPNPVHGDLIQVAFDAQFAGKYEVTAYTLAGGRAASIHGEIPKAGRLTTAMAIKQLAS